MSFCAVFAIRQDYIEGRLESCTASALHSTKISKYVSNPVQILNLTGGFWGFSLCEHCGKLSQRIELWLLKDTQSSLADWTAKIFFFPASSAHQNNQHVFSFHKSFSFAVLDNNWRLKNILYEIIYKITILSSWMVVGFEEDGNNFMNVILCKLRWRGSTTLPFLPGEGRGISGEMFPSFLQKLRLHGFWWNQQK